MRGQKNSLAGFAMVDTLVALTLLSITGAAIITAQILSSKSARNAHQKITALAVAKSQLQTSDRSAAGNTTIDGYAYRWVVQVDLPQPNLAAREVQLLNKSVTVEWGEDGNDAKTLTLATKTLR